MFQLPLHFQSGLKPPFLPQNNSAKRKQDNGEGMMKVQGSGVISPANKVG
jgi:hypothetical protein